MFKSLRIRNFQAHKDTTIDFSKNITMFVGSGMAGKTAIFRALNWILSNSPLGFSFLRYGESETSVTLVIDVDGKDVSIERVRNKSENYYRLNGEKLEANKGKVPDDVARLLNVSEINMQDQFSPYFLVFDSPGKVGQFINDLTGLSEIDDVVSKLSSAIKANASSLSMATTALEIDTVKLEQAEKIDIELLEDCIQTCEMLQVQINAITDKSATLTTIITSLQDVNKKLTSYESLDIDGIIRTLSNELLRTAQIESIQTKMLSLQGILNKLEKVKEELANITEISVPDVQDSVNKLATSIARNTSLNKLIVELTTTKTTLHSLSEQQTRASEQMQQIEKSITICPLCKQELKTEDAKRNIGL